MLKYGVTIKEKCYEHKPEAVVEEEQCKILWGPMIQILCGTARKI